MTDKDTIQMIRKDITERLRDRDNHDCIEAADEIERLRKELDTRIAMCDMCSEKIIELTNERDEARRLAETIARDVSQLSTRPADIIKFGDLVDLINEWGDAARKILDEKDNTDE